MELAISYRWRDNTTEKDTKAVRKLFMAWEAPRGVGMKAHYYFARGGGIVIVDADNASALFEGLAPFTPTIEFDIEPIFNVIEAIAISMDVEEWAADVLSKPAEEQRR
ncbi:MAG TPA: DUF3303 family protein [Dehalococcoidia bacterium]|nr:DUF3303 family protein [Dehalococcoidia bacterium]